MGRMGGMLIESLTIDAIAEFVDRSDVVFFATAVNPHNIGICSFFKLKYFVLFLL